MNTGIIILGLSCLFTLPLSAQWDTNVYPLTLTGLGNLKDVFDSGLRPKRENAAYRCIVVDKTIRFDLGGDYVATIPAEMCLFKIFSSDQVLQSIEAETPPLTLAETRTWMSPVGRGFGRTAKELDDFLELVRNGHRGFGWLGRDNIQGLVVTTPRPAPESGMAWMSVRLKHHAADPQRPIRIAVAIEWERPRREFDYPQTPLQSPKGYEDFSMEPEPFVPSWIRRGEPASPEVQRQYGDAGVRQLREQYAAKMGRSNVPSSAVSLPTAVSTESNASAIPAAAAPHSFKWLWLAGISLAAILLLLWIAKRQKPRQ